MAELSDKEFCDNVHLKIHAVRMASNYKSSEMDKQISKLVIDKFSGTCMECHDIGARNKLMPPKKDGFMERLKGVLE